MEPREISGLMRAAIAFIAVPPRLDLVLAPLFMRAFLWSPAETVFAALFLIYFFWRRGQRERTLCYMTVVVWAALHLLPTQIDIGAFIYLRDALCVFIFWLQHRVHVPHAAEIVTFVFFLPVGARTDSSWTMCARVLCTLVLNYNTDDTTEWIEWAYPLVCSPVFLVCAFAHAVFHFVSFRQKEAVS